jgi:Arc/MetJ family transcription regulator
LARPSTGSRRRRRARPKPAAERESSGAVHLEVYACSMGRTNIDIDDELVARVMRIYRLTTKRQAVDYALRRLVAEPLSRDEALAMEGSGWQGDLNAMRRDRVPEL